MADEHLRKAAILLLSLSEDQAASLLAKLTAQEVELVSAEIARLGQPSGDEQQAVIREFAVANPSSPVQSDHQAGAVPLPFSRLKDVDPQDLLFLIRDENPQTIALILSHLPPAHAAQIVQALPLEMALTVLRRMADLGPTSPEIIQEVERVLAGQVAKLPSDSSKDADSAGHVVEILNALDATTERGLLQSLAHSDPALVELVRWQMVAGENSRKVA
jgi:Flagellar motor switch protein